MKKELSALLGILIVALLFSNCQKKSNDSNQHFNAEFTEFQSKYELLGEEILKKRYQIYLLENLIESPIVQNVGDRGLWQGGPDISSLFKSECDMLYSKFIKKCEANDQPPVDNCRLVASLLQHFCEYKKRREQWLTLYENELSNQRLSATKDLKKIMSAYDELLNEEKNMIEIFNSKKTPFPKKIKQVKEIIKNLKKENSIMFL